MARAAFTLLYLSATRLVRADFTRDGRFLGQWQQGRPDVEDPALLVEVALAQGPRPGRKLWVLASDLWCHTVRLGASSMGLQGDNLARALAFEAEPLSGISGLESMVAYTLMSTANGEREFRVVQARLADLVAMRDAAEQAGTRLEGVCHPAGLPAPVQAAQPRWSRLELWPDMTVALVQQQNDLRTAFVPGDPVLGRWRASAAELTASFTEVLTERGAQNQFVPPGAACWCLEDDETLQAWLTAWGKHLNQGTRSVPLVRAPAKPLSASARGLIAVGLALVVGLVCVVHHFLAAAPKLEALRIELARAQEKAMGHEAAKKQVAAKEKEASELDKRNGELDKSVHALRTQRERLARLLASLASMKSDSLVLRKIDGAQGEPTLQGWCLEPTGAGELAQALGPIAGALGWRLESPKTKALHALPSGGPWEFELRLQDTLVVGASAADLATAGKKGKR